METLFSFTHSYSIVVPIINLTQLSIKSSASETLRYSLKLDLYQYISILFHKGKILSREPISWIGKSVHILLSGELYGELA